jgi:hypothetical protein
MKSARILSGVGASQFVTIRFFIRLFLSSGGRKPLVRRFFTFRALPADAVISDALERPR